VQIFSTFFSFPFFFLSLVTGGFAVRYAILHIMRRKSGDFFYALPQLFYKKGLHFEKSCDILIL